MTEIWLSKPSKDILQYIKTEYGTKDLKFIGQYYCDNGITRFVNVKTLDYFSLNFLGNEELNIGYKGKKLWVHIHNEVPNLKHGTFYIFKAKLSSQNIRIKHQNPFALQIDESYIPIEYKPEPKDFIRRRFEIKKHTHLADNQNLAKALKTIEREINKSPETFIFELLQNANDYPDKERNYRVHASFKVSDNHLLFCHSGAKFNVDNVHSICSINESDKSDNLDKIGFKGIGFKSVFKDCNYAYINSGGYSFRFDSTYFISEKPYQIIPIWTDKEEVDPDVVESTIFKNSSVSIALKPRKKEKLNEYKAILLKLFTDDRILLFLPNVENVKVISPVREEFKESKKNLFNYWIGRYTVSVPENIQEWINKEIEDNETVVPEKYYDIRKTEIQFATSRLLNEIVKTDKSVIYNYLPTKVNLGFDFIINGDFIPDGSRDFFHDIEWNHFLIEQAGYKFIDWLKSIGNKKDEQNTSRYKFKRDYIKLIPDFISITKQIVDPRNEKLVPLFKKGFDLAITGVHKNKPIPFIPTQTGTLRTLSEILIDKTGISNILKDDFNSLTGVNGFLVHKDIGEGLPKLIALVDEYKLGTIFGVQDLKLALKTNEFQAWLKMPANSFAIISHFDSNSDLQELLKSEKIFLNSNNELVSSTSLYYDIPKEVSFLNINVLNSELYKLIKDKELSFKLLTFEPVAFFKKHIVDKEEAVNSLLLIEDKLLSFWQFVYNNWESIEKDTTITKSLKKINILCKSKNKNELNCKPISQTYLSTKYNSTSSVEEVINKIEFTDANFISEKYIADNYKIENWRKIFLKLGTATNLQTVISNVIPKLSKLDHQKHFEIGKQIFRYWKDNKDKDTPLSNDQIKTVRENLKIKCSDGTLQKTKDCIIPDHYTTNPIIDSLLPEIVLTNQISNEYEKRTNNVVDWNNFFKLIACQSLLEQKDVFNAKIENLLQNQEEYHEKHFEILQALSKLFKEKKNNNFSFDKLSKLHLKTNTGEWLLPNQIHFSSVYNPKLDLQSDETVKNSYKFLSDDYKKNNINKQLLAKLGVSTSFHFKVCEICRSEIPNKYRLEFEKRSNYIIQNAVNYDVQHRLVNHIELNYLELLEYQHYAELFWKEVSMPNSIYHRFLFQKTTYKMAFRSVLNDNIVITYLKTKDYFPNQENELKKTTELFSYSLSNYIDDKKCLPKYDLTKIFSNDGESTSLEEAIGIQQTLSIEHCIELISRKENRITLTEIEELQIVEILSKYSPTSDEKKSLYLLNADEEWKPLTELFISGDEEFQIEPNKQLHEVFHPIANAFGIPELSEEKLLPKFIPEEPVVSDDIKTSLIDKAKYIAFKIDPKNYQEVETELIEKVNLLSFYELESIEKVFPIDNPIFKTELNIYTEADNVFYKGYWKINSDVIAYLFELIEHDKVEKLWFENVINRWDDSKIIENLNENVGATPSEWNSIIESENNVDASSQEETDSFWTNLNVDDENFIRGIIKGEYELNEQLDANTTAKIKTLMQIRYKYKSHEISDEDLYLKAGEDEILVRSAQNGLLYLDLYHWERLNESNVHLAVYTKNQIEIYETQESLIQFTKPQNKFGILRLPVDYSLEDYNSLENINNKGKWHFVFIVNENTKAAQNYKEFINLDEYNF